MAENRVFLPTMLKMEGIIYIFMQMHDIAINITKHCKKRKYIYMTEFLGCDWP